MFSFVGVTADIQTSMTENKFGTCRMVQGLWWLHAARPWPDGINPHLWLSVMQLKVVVDNATTPRIRTRGCQVNWSTALQLFKVVLVVQCMCCTIHCKKVGRSVSGTVDLELDCTWHIHQIVQEMLHWLKFSDGTCLAPVSCHTWH